MITAIPSPEQAVWYLGPIPIRAYALCILAGIVVALLWTGRRLDARGARADAVWDIAIWVVPLGIVGGRLYHVITTPGPYFGPGGHPIDALKIWHGGLGIWGAVALGARQDREVAAYGLDVEPPAGAVRRRGRGVRAVDRDGRGDLDVVGLGCRIRHSPAPP